MTHIALVGAPGHNPYDRRYEQALVTDIALRVHIPSLLAGANYNELQSTCEGCKDEEFHLAQKMSK